jgi:ArsR family transcriptional regulator, arsenate/arsenite/antimonite-responsive transcriptional repressor
MMACLSDRFVVVNHISGNIEIWGVIELGDDLTENYYIHKSRYMESESVILALAALAQSTRLDVFRLLARHEPDGLAAGDIAKALAVPQNTMSSHLAILSRAGLVSAQRFSRSIVYRADLRQFQAVVLFMLQDCCDGRPEICAPLIESLTPCCPLPKKKRAHAKL